MSREREVKCKSKGDDVEMELIRAAGRMKWEQVPCSNGPSPRHSHTSVAVGDSVWIFGGTDGKQMFNELWRFDTKSKEWSQPEATGGVEPRVLTSADVQNNVIYFHGGRTASGNVGDTVAFDIGA